MTDKTKKTNLVSKKSSNPESSVQLDLFSNFISNDDDKVSNSIELWESFPKYHFSPQIQKMLRDSEGKANPVDWEFKKGDSTFSIRSNPAPIEISKGVFQHHFPGPIEELVEEALKKLLTKNDHGVHIREKSETWVVFSWNSLRDELQKNGHDIKISRLRLAIDIMSQSIISIYKDDKKIYSNAILSDLTLIRRDDYLDDPNARNLVRMSVFITNAIEKLEYRQFNYETFMHLSMQLSRWLYKRLVNKYRQANHDNTYHFSLKSIQKQSALLQMKNFRDNKLKCEKALDELVKHKVLHEWYITRVDKTRKKIDDVIYELRPAYDFVKDQKASNSRTKTLKNNNNLKLAN